MSSRRLPWALLIAALAVAGLWKRPMPERAPPPTSASSRANSPGSASSKPRSPAPPKPSPTDVFASAEVCRDAVARGERRGRAAQRARFASWNLRWFPDGAPGNVEPGTDLSWLACVLTWLDADVVAVQEVKQTPKAVRALATLLRELNQLSGRRYRAELDDCGRRVPQHVGLLFDEALVKASQLRTVGALNPLGAPCEGQLRPGFMGRFAFPGGLDLSVVSAHFKSHADERSLGLREASFAVLPSVQREAAQMSRDPDWLLLGDLNTMGCERCEPPVSAREELSAVERALEPHGLRLLPADAAGTELHRGRYVWLDHALSSRQMRELPAGARVHVAGPCGKGAAPRSKLPLSDHCPLLLDLTDADLD